MSTNVTYDWDLDTRQCQMILFLATHAGYTADKVAQCVVRPTGCRRCRVRLAGLVIGGYVHSGPAATLDGGTDGLYLTLSGQRLAVELRRRDLLVALVERH